MYQFLREEDAMMSSFLGGGFDAPHTPSMSRGEEDSVEESKVPDPNLVDTGDSGGNDPHQCGDADAQDWNAEILNHVLVHILNKEQVDAGATDDLPCL